MGLLFSFGNQCGRGVVQDTGSREVRGVAVDRDNSPSRRDRPASAESRVYWATSDRMARMLIATSTPTWRGA
jgi:hypothetical protein